jgi:hypothetical protein
VADLRLEPYAAVQLWRLPEADGRWESILADYLQALAQRCAASPQAVIGHLKAMALFSKGGYLRVSVIAAHIPATVSGQVPAGYAELELTLNVLVYGLPWTEIEQIVHETSTEFASRWKGVVDHKVLNQAVNPGHHSHHHDQQERNNE